MRTGTEKSRHPPLLRGPGSGELLTMKHRTSPRRQLWSIGFLLCLSFSAAAGAESFPDIIARTLGGATVQLPNDLEGRVNVLVIGFTQKAGSNTAPWVRGRPLAAVSVLKLAAQAVFTALYALTTLGVAREISGRALVEDQARTDLKRSGVVLLMVA